MIDENKPNKFDRDVINIETLCRKNGFYVLRKQDAYCDHICPENNCIYRDIYENGFKQYRCMSIEHIGLWKYEQ